MRNLERQIRDKWSEDGNIMENADKIILFGAGKIGRRVLEIVGSQNVHCFVDNYVRTADGKVSGIEVKTPEYLKSVKTSFPVVIAVSQQFRAEIVGQLQELGINCFYDSEDYIRNNYYHLDEIIKVKDMFKGKRCFLIGSGPSLRVEDLEMLEAQGEICFGCNKIFKIFDETTWRPQLYCATDLRITTFYQEEISNLDLEIMFVAYRMHKELHDTMEKLRKKKNVYLFAQKDNADDTIEFSEDLSKYIFEGRTVIYSMIQLAYYMGFSEVYLLGIDFSYNDKSGYDNKKNDHFCKNYIAEGEVVLPAPMEHCKKAFETARTFGDSHDFKIYNATRGGKLEVFERVSIDEILKSGGK